MRDDLGSWFEFSYRNGKFDWLKLEDLDQSYFSNVFRVIDPDNLTPLEKFFIKIRKKFQ